MKQERIFTYLFWIILNIIIILFITACEQKPEGYKDGKPFYTKSVCIRSHTKTVYEYHWGYSVMKGKYCWHWGMNDKTICDEARVDTVWLKVKNK